MYPYFRALKVFFQPKKESITLSDKTSIPMRVWFADIDIYPELNNGRHLTLMDLGRYDFGKKVGLFQVLKAHNWGLMVAGNFTRYRRRVKFLQKFSLETEMIGYDERWFYFYQKTVRNNVQHSSALIRTAVTSSNGLVGTKEVAEAMKINYAPEIPAWVEDWIELNENSPALQ